MYKIHTYRGKFCNILIFSTLQALLVVIPSKFEYNLAIVTGPSSKRLS